MTHSSSPFLFSINSCPVAGDFNLKFNVPAAGTSIGLSVNPLDFSLIFFIIFSVLFLYLVKLALDKYGKNII